MSEHTPGPWRTFFNGIYWEFGQENTIQALGNVCATGFHERDHEPYEGFSGTEEANARLIAASPCLLEALEKLNSAIDDFWNAPREDRMPLVGDDYLVRAITDAQQAAFTAIQKARVSTDG